MTVGESLAGVKVLDLSLQLPGPWATTLLTSLGAEVLKVEPPAGDPAREIDPPMFRRLIGSKRIINVDLKSEEGREEVRELAVRSDVLVEGFRPGVAARLGAGPEEMMKLNPRLVYCSISGFGLGGPLSGHPGHDLNFLGLSGGATAEAGVGSDPIRVPFVDLAAGTQAALMITAALKQRETTGKGVLLETALLDSAISWASIKLPQPGGEPVYGVFETEEGHRVAIAVLEEAMWQRLCVAFEWTDWQSDAAGLSTNEGRRSRAEEIEGRLCDAVGERSFNILMSLALEHDLAITPVMDAELASRNAQVRSREVLPVGDSWRPLGRSGARVSLKAAQ